MPSYKSFEEIPVWQVAHKAALEIYSVTKKFPREELYGLIFQIRRSAASVPANIAEGFYRNTTKELIKFLYNARGSCGETIYHLILARDLKYISLEEFKNLSQTYHGIARQLNNWINSLRRKV